MWDSPHLSHPTLPLSSLLLGLCGVPRKHGPIPSLRFPTDKQGLEQVHREVVHPSRQGKPHIPSA